MNNAHYYDAQLFEASFFWVFGDIATKRSAPDKGLSPDFVSR